MTDIGDLQRAASTSLANYDYTEQNKRREYENSLQQAADNRRKSLVNANIQAADNGLARSGIALKNNVDVNQGYDQQNAGLAQQLNSSLAEIARQRLADQVNYNLQIANARRAQAANTNGGGGYYASEAPAPVPQLQGQALAKQLNELQQYAGFFGLGG